MQVDQLRPADHFRLFFRWSVLSVSGCCITLFQTSGLNAPLFLLFVRETYQIFQKRPSSHDSPQGLSSRKLSQQNISLWAKDAGRSDWLQFYPGRPLAVGVHYGKKDTPSERLREMHPVSSRAFTHNAELILLFDLAQQNSV